MVSLNKVFLIGNLTRDPELRYTQSGTPVCDFGIAVNRFFTTSEGEKRQDVCFVEITVWGRTAETCGEYLSKGRLVFIEGRLEMDTWETPEGHKRSKLRVRADRVQFLSRPGEGPGEKQPMPGLPDEPPDSPRTQDDEIPF